MIYAAGAGLALSLAAPDASPRAAAPLATPAQAGNWHVTEGSLGFSVRQFGSDVQGSFADWTADITFDETATNGKHGQVTVTIAIPSLSLGSVTEQAKAADFFDAPTYSTAIFTADILPAEAGYIARRNPDASRRNPTDRPALHACDRRRHRDNGRQHHA